MTSCQVSSCLLSSCIVHHFVHLGYFPAWPVIMSMGSPALAAYSLILSSLNVRVVFRSLKHIRHKSKTGAANALRSLQQIPLELTRDQNILTTIPSDDQWEREITERLDKRNAWSVATGTSVSWVVIAFIFTLIDSFVSLNGSSEPSEGLEVGILWLWLLCLVIGWLWVPTFTSRELRRAVGHANRQASERADQRFNDDAGKADEKAPLDDQSITLSPRSLTRNSAALSQLVDPTKASLFIHKDKVSSLNRDELRLSATFNYSRVIRYLALVDDVSKALGKLTHDKDGVGPSGNVVIFGDVS